MKGMKKLVVIGAAVLFLGLAITPSINADIFSVEQSTGNKQVINNYVKGEIIVGFKDKQTIAKSASIVEAYGGISILERDEIFNMALVKVNGKEEQAFIEKISSDPQVKYAELNKIIYACDIPNDPEWEVQWGPTAINCEDAWELNGYGSKDVLVAIVDTGIDYNHEDIKENYVALGHDWANNDDDPIDDQGHGTHCAGIAAGVTNNGKGIAGVAQVSVMAEKVLTNWGGGTAWAIKQGIVHAVDVGADVISMSLGSSSPSPTIKKACDYAWNNNVVVVAAAGNDGAEVGYPAAYDSVIAVGAIDSSLKRCYWSNHGEKLELAAPGDEILSTVVGNDYEFYSGTSMACPHVAGVAGLLKSWGFEENSDIREKMKETAIDLGTEGKDNYYGYGLVDAFLNGEAPAGKLPFFIAVHKIEGLDPIEPPGAGDPEWYYQITVRTTKSEETQYNFNLHTIPQTTLDSIWWEYDWISEDPWYPETVHMFYVDGPIVVVNIFLKESDVIFDDEADISSSPTKKWLSLVYDIENRDLLEDQSDEVHKLGDWYVADGELDDNDKDEDDARFWFMLAYQSEIPPEISNIHIEGEEKKGVPLTFSGRAQSGILPYRWFWNFGDGSSSSEEEPVHTYENAGTYVITATVIDSQNQSSDKFYKLIRIISDQAPVVSSLTGDQYLTPDERGTYEAIAIDPNALDVAYGWDWDNDGFVDDWTNLYPSGVLCTYSHSWDAGGTYIVKVKARNTVGDESRFATLEVSVPRSRQTSDPLLIRFLEKILGHFPVLEELFQRPIFNNLLEF